MLTRSTDLPIAADAAWALVKRADTGPSLFLPRSTPAG